MIFNHLHLDVISVLNIIRYYRDRNLCTNCRTGQIRGARRAETGVYTQSTVDDTHKPQAISAKPKLHDLQQVLKHSEDIAEVLHAYLHSEDEVTVDCADMRLRELLKQQDGEACFEQLLAAKLSLKTCRDLAVQAKSSALRFALLEKLTDDQYLLEVIARSDDVATKVAAIARLQHATNLQGLVKQFKGKQKKLYRAAKDRLHTVRQQQKAIANLQSHADSLANAIIKQSVSNSAIARFAKQLQETRACLSHAQQAQFTQQLELAKNSAQAIEQYKSERLQLIDRLDKLQQQLQAKTFIGKRSELNRSINDCQHRWAQLTAWPTEEAQALAIRFEQTLSKLNTTAGDYFAEQHLLHDSQQVFAQAQRWLDKKIFISAAMLQDWQKRWQALTPPDNPEIKKQLHDTFSELLTKLSDKSRQQLQQQQTNDKQVPQLVEEMAAALEAGEVKRAIKRQNAIRVCLRSDAGLSKPVYQAIAGRFKRLENRVNELMRWQHFGNDQVRHELLEAMQVLRDNTALPLEEKAEQIHRLQQHWKSLGGHAPDKLWKAFQTLADEAWEPCGEFFKQRRETSRASLQQRLDFLTEAEQHLHSVDWQNPDWEALSNAHKQFEKLWRSFPKLQEKDYRKAKKAYQKIAAIWDEHLGAQRRHELHRREQLITGVEALINQADTHAAIDEVKRLQSQWTPTVPLKRQDQEQALWQRFQTACDSIFAKHQQQKQTQADKQTRQLAEYQQQLTYIAEVLDANQDSNQGSGQVSSQGSGQGSGQDNKASKPSFEALVAQIEPFANVEPAARKALNARLNDLKQRFKQQQHKAYLQKHLQHLEDLQRQDSLCGQLETEAVDNEQLISAEKAWASITPLLDDGQPSMQKRFKQALQEQRQGRLMAADDNAIARAKVICLIMEVSADIPSPDYAKAARETLRMQNLDNAMNGDRSFEQYATESGCYDLSVEWLCLPKAGLDKAQDGASLPDWQKRFATALAANYQRLKSQSEN